MINPGNVTPNYTDPSNPSSGSRTNQTWQEDTDTGGNEPQVPQRDPNAPINEGEGGGGNYGSEMPNDHNPQYGGHLTNEGLGVFKVSYQTNSSQQQQAQPSNVISSYQAQVSKLKSAGFSGQDIQNWSDNQAVKLRQAGFSQDEVDAYQGMKTPPPGQPAVYGRLPTDADFKNAASVMLGGNDHPFYEKAVDSLKSLFSQTGVEPAEAVKASQEIPSFRAIMENGGDAPPSPTWGEYGTKIAHDALGAVASGMQGLSVMHAYLNPDDPGVPVSEQGANPETSQMYQKGVAFQKWLDDKFASNPETEKNNPIKMGLAGGVGSLAPLIATGGVGIAATGAGSAYQEAKQAGAPIEKATEYATKMGGVWGALGIADVGVFLKPIERSAPGLIPWITAKATQALRSGAMFAGTNEFGNWLSSEIAQAADIPIQYKPTAQQIVVNATLGAVAGMVAPTTVKRAPVTAEAPRHAYDGTEPPPPPPSAPATTLTPAYHFDSDTYGLKNEKGEFVQTGFPTEQDARTTAEQAPAPTYPPQESRLTPEVIDRYKKTISDEAEKNGIPLTPEQLQRAATVMAESHNPVVEPQKPEVTPPEQPAYATVPKKPLGLADFVRSIGGLKNEGGELTAMDADKSHRDLLTGLAKPFVRKLVKNDGLSFDEAALRASEDGYFPELNGERPDINQFLEKIREDLGGNPQHSLHDADKVEAYNDALRYNAETDKISNETGIQAEGKTHTQFWDEVTKYYSRDQVAEKKADFAQRAQESYESWRTEALEPEERLSKEELEHERTQDNITKDQKSIPKSPVESRSATEYSREGEAIGGLGGRGIESTGSARPAEAAEAAPATSVRTDTGERGGNAARGNAESNNLEEELLYHKGEGILSAKELSSPEIKELQDFAKQIAPNSRFAIHQGDIIGKDGTRATASYNPIEDLIKVATTSSDKLKDTAHEALHAVVHLLTDGEYEKLVNEGLSRKLIDKYNIEQRYSDRPDLHQEEMIAHWFGDWARDKRTAGSQEAKGIFGKIKDMLSQIGAKIRQVFGTDNTEDIMNRIYSGEVGSRAGERLSEERELYNKTAEEEKKPTLGDAMRGIRDTFLADFGW